MADSLKLHFNKPGLLTTVQDGGRNGYQHLGIPVNGFMDEESAHKANMLVGNERDGPLLEITLLGPEIRFEGKGQMALTGADLSANLNGERLDTNRTISVSDGDLLKFGRPIQGCRAYLAVAGSWQVKAWLGSMGASAVDATSLTPDSVMKKDSVLEVICERQVESQLTEKTQLAVDADPTIIQVIPGPEFSQLSNLSIASFFSQDFTISNDSNRMGYRLEGQLADFHPVQEAISSGIIPGTIQLTNSGQPIVLMADAQTSGGYYRLGNLTRKGMNRLAQKKPGEKVRFVLRQMEDQR